MTADLRPAADSSLRRRRRRAERPEHHFRPEVQGLRAVAVLLVVGYHLWPNRLSGGYVGVDVFFVISGFLITAHIHREVLDTGSLRLLEFWARRIRRLLPASLLVLAISAVGVALLAPPTVWAQSARQLAASALYVQNWALARDAVDYMAADNVPTVAQHYWSLSVEEQFYLVWPLLVLGLVALGRRGRHVGAAVPERPGRLLVPGLALLAAASLTWSVVSTSQDQALAYLSTLTRVWEFAAGALVALVAARGVRRPVVGAVLGWAGVGAVVLAGFVLDDASAFPGWVALLPVLGTAALIVAGPGGLLTAGGWLSLRPARFVGDISYSVYLVHWPLIVLVPYATGRSLSTVDKLAILGATLVLAWASKTYVEDPWRRRQLIAAAPRRAFAFAAAGMLVIVAGSVGLTGELQRRQDAAEARAAAVRAQEAACLGPRAMDDPDACGGVMGDGEWLVPPEVVTRRTPSRATAGASRRWTPVTSSPASWGRRRTPGGPSPSSGTPTPPTGSRPSTGWARSRGGRWSR